MRAYVSKIKNIAMSLRNNEIMYIKNMASKSEGLLSNDNLSRL